MSEEQVEVVRKHIEAYRRRDVSVSLSFMDPHAVLDMNRVDGSDPSLALSAKGTCGRARPRVYDRRR
jgi:hypothetical protein